jgi:hypothetical protein
LHPEGKNWTNKVDVSCAADPDANLSLSILARNAGSISYNPGF